MDFKVFLFSSAQYKKTMTKIKTVKVQVYRPVTNDIYSVDIKLIGKEGNSSEYKIEDNNKNLREITVCAEDPKTFLKLITRASLEVAEDAYYSAFPELNKLGMAAEEYVRMEETILQGLCKDDIVSSVISQILAGYFID